MALGSRYREKTCISTQRFDQSGWFFYQGKRHVPTRDRYGQDCWQLRSSVTIDLNKKTWVSHRYEIHHIWNSVKADWMRRNLNISIMARGNELIFLARTEACSRFKFMYTTLMRVFFKHSIFIIYVCEVVNFFCRGQQWRLTKAATTLVHIDLEYEHVCISLVKEWARLVESLCKCSIFSRYRDFWTTLHYICRFRNRILLI